MKRNNLKFVVGSAAIVITLVYLAVANANGFYSKTVADLRTPTEALYKQSLRVAGRVVHGSIERDGRVVRFKIHDKDNEGVTYPVEYRGKEPLPDLFRDRADVNVDGRLDRSGVFVGDTVAAKCASKYPEETMAVLQLDANGRVMDAPGVTETLVEEGN